MGPLASSIGSFRVNPPAKPKNPLWFVAIAFLLTLPFGFYSYIGQSFLTAFGLVVIAAKLVFPFLYIRHSRFAWHVGAAVTAAITPLSFTSGVGSNYDSAKVCFAYFGFWQ
jgi:hypothetical protein